MNPYHLINSAFTVKYKKKLIGPLDVYGDSHQNFTKEILEFYNIIIIIGKYGEGYKELITLLSSHGFHEVRGNDLTGIFTRSRRRSLEREIAYLDN